MMLTKNKFSRIKKLEVGMLLERRVTLSHENERYFLVIETDVKTSELDSFSYTKMSTSANRIVIWDQDWMCDTMRTID